MSEMISVRRLEIFILYELHFTFEETHIILNINFSILMYFERNETLCSLKASMCGGALQICTAYKYVPSPSQKNPYKYVSYNEPFKNFEPYNCVPTL